MRASRREERSCAAVEPNRARLYVIALVLMISVGLTGVALMNALCDPYSAYPRFGVDALAVHSDQIGSRTARAEMLRQGDWDVVIVGSSRAQVGYAPDHPVFAGQKVLNASLVWTNIRELEVVHRYTLEHARPRRVLLAIDFLLFTGQRDFSLDFTHSRFNAERDQVSYHLDNLISMRASFTSLKMLKGAALKEPPEFTLLGQSVRHAARLRTGHRRLFAATLHGFFTNPETCTDFDYSEDRLDRLHSMLAEARQAGVPVDIAINPVHATQLKALDLADLWPTFERWLADVVDVVAQERAEGSQIRLFSFLDFEPRCDEPVPAAGDTKTEMTYWWESSHFKSTLGGLVLQRLYGQADSTELDFGWELTPDSVPTYIVALRAGRRS